MDSQDFEKELDLIKQKVEENNRILKRIQTARRWSIFTSIVKWVVYIAIFTGLYLTMKPLMQQISSIYGTIQSGASMIGEQKDNIQNIDFGSLLNLFN